MTAPKHEARVGVVMGSDSDLRVMEQAVEALDELGIASEVRVTSAHRTPELMFRYAAEALDRGLEAIIAGAGGAAHLPGMLASVTPLPVIGVPISLQRLDGLDSLLSIVQMPAGVPVATVAIDSGRNAGLLAARILASGDPELTGRLKDHQARLARAATEKDRRVREMFPGDGSDERK